MKKILVTGADGFIGSHLVEALLKAGHNVRAFTYYNSFNSWGWLDTFPSDMLKKIDIFSGDIRDPNGVRKAMEGIPYNEKFGFDDLMHNMINKKTLPLVIDYPGYWLDIGRPDDYAKACEDAQILDGEMP